MQDQPVPSESRWGILADDLTGAMDVAASFADQGFIVNVILNRRLRPIGTEDIVVLSTDSRNIKPTSAQKLVRKALKRFDRWGFELLYKKIDSTCKGNLVAEMDAISRNLHRQCMLCPANLSQGRTLRGGWLTVHGKRLLDVRDLLHQQGAAIVPVFTNRNAVEVKKWSIDRHVACMLVDAQRPSQLTRLAEWANRNREQVLLVGSANAASALAKELANDDQTIRRRQKRFARNRSEEPISGKGSPSVAERPILVFSGSRNPVNDRQIEYLKKHSRIVEVAFDRTGAIAAQPMLERNRDVLVSIPTHQRSASLIQERLDLFTRLLHPERVAGLVICGGDTACAVLESLRPGAVRVFGALMSGLAWGQLLRGSADGLLLCTKPGGFGTADALRIAVRSLRATQFQHRKRR